MVLKRICILLMSFVMLISSLSAGAAVDSGEPLKLDRMSKVKMRTSSSNSININKASYGNYDPLKCRADFDSVEYRSIKGEIATVSVDGSVLSITSDSCNDIILCVYEDNSDNIERYKADSDSVSLDLSDINEEGLVYRLEFSLQFYSGIMEDIALNISSDEYGDLFFIESPAYKHNIKELERLETTGEYLDKCLESALDIESDNYDVIEFSNKLCRECNDDYEKVYAIYSYIIENMYYDYNQMEDEGVFVDDAVTMIRSDRGVCEGFSNMLVALCRAQGIPATEVYGCGYDYGNIWFYDLDEVIHSNHAWAMVYVDEQWMFLDPTWDNNNSYYDGEYEYGEATTNFIYLPVESYSYTHYIMDVDISHSVVASGSCGPNATYEIDSDGVCTIHGEGSICMPPRVDDFYYLVFDKESEIDEISEDCFIDCDHIRYVVLPDTVEYIGEYAFAFCEDLEYVYIPNDVSYIGDLAFFACDRLSYIAVPDGCIIGGCVFDSCPRLILSVEDTSDLNLYAYSYLPMSIIER